jgi:prepilin-type processing-associated H-X9-DG protein
VQNYCGVLTTSGLQCWAAVPKKVFHCPSDPRAGTIASWGGSPGNEALFQNYFACCGNVNSQVRGSASYGPNSRHRSVNLDGGSGLDVITAANFQPWNEYNGLFGMAMRVKVGSCTDGLSNTFLLGERPIDGNGSWGWEINCAEGDGMIGTGFPMIQLNSTNFNPNGYLPPAFGSYHTGGAHLAMGDGSVRFVSANISNITWLGLGSRAGGEVLGEF